MQDDNEENDVVPKEPFFSPEDENQQPTNGNDGVPLMINGQYIKDLSFEAPNAPDVFSLIQNETPNIEVNIDVEAAPKGENFFEVELKVNAKAEVNNQLVYLCEVIYAGLFTLNVPQEHVGPVLLIECPLIIFPFMRRIVADLTGDGGFAPLMLAPIDFASLYQQRVMATADNKTTENSEEESAKEDK